MKLMILESPNKVASVSKYVAGKDIKVIASMGHIRELDTSLKNHGAVEVDNGFQQHFVLNTKNEKNTREVLKLAKKADEIYLATDLDIQGSAIAWHLRELIKTVNPNVTFKRLMFNEINQQSILNAIDHAGELNMNEVHAQFALQALDYLVGFCLSPLLWKVVSRGTSAGRVQSPSLRLIVEREKQIRAFVPDTYWVLQGTSNKDKIGFPVKLNRIGAKNLKAYKLTSDEYSEEKVKQIHQEILSLVKSGQKLHVSNVHVSKQTRKPKAPYTTAGLLRDAVNKLGWGASRVMSVAQKLFEGNGNGGYITYHRTDSPSLSQEALNQIFAFGQSKYAEHMESKPNVYKTKSKNVQEAHEAIRPTNIALTPLEAKDVLMDEQYRLYKLIWERTLASQMKPMVLDSTTVLLDLNQEYGFKTTGSVITYPGYSVVYQEGLDLDSDKEEMTRLPVLSMGDKLVLNNPELLTLQTKAPRRYNEASLVKTLEELGIGRPSTYAVIFKNLKDRNYVTLDQGSIQPTDLGIVISDYLVQHFPLYVDYQFTSNLNDELDKIEKGELNWKQVLYSFWVPFNELVEKESKEHVLGTGVLEQLDEICPKCGQANLKLMIGKYGKFKCCSRGKKVCNYIESLSDHQKPEAKVFEGKSCPNCNGRLMIRQGYKGKFLGCEYYKHSETPCSYTCNADGSEIVRKSKLDLKIKCPKCKKNNLFLRQGKNGPMVSCGGFPRCRNLIKRDDYPKVLDKTVEDVAALIDQLT